MARGKCARGPRGLHSTRAAPPPAAHFEPDGALRPAGAQAAYREGQGLPQRRSPPAARHRRTGRDRRKMGLRHEGLHQVGMPGGMTRSQKNFQTAGCSIIATANGYFVGRFTGVLSGMAGSCY